MASKDQKGPGREDPEGHKWTQTEGLSKQRQTREAAFAHSSYSSWLFWTLNTFDVKPSK